MWSDQYWYYNIRSDANYCQSLPTNEIVKLLESLSALKKKGPQVFTNQDNFPWLDITCVYSNKGNFAHNDGDQTDNVNLITIVTSRRIPENESKYVEFLKTIADKLKWELILEEDDDGNKDVRLN